MRSIRYLLSIFLMPVLLFSASVAEKFSACNYVLSEFDIDSSYAYDEYFTAYVEKRAKQMQHFYRKAAMREKWLVTMVRGELLEEDISDLFLYLSIVESGLQSDIVSPKKAVGLWQFMPVTAKHYNLLVCSSVDERCDPVSATKAAIRYLRKLHDRFGKWYLAVLAYNCGEGRLSKALKKAGTDDLSILLDEQQKYLPKETRDYLKKILLVAMIGESEMISMEQERVEKTPIQVEIKGGIDLRDIAKKIHMDPQKILSMNSAYKTGILPNDRRFYPVLIPEESIVRFYLTDEPDIPEDIHRDYLLSHQVVLGETLQSIADRYHADRDEIKRANRLEGEMLEVDMLLVIPVDDEIFYQYTEE